MLNARYTPCPARDNSGAATLATLMVLLLLMGMTTLLAARVLLGDQLGSDALVQAQQRQSLNESGLDWGMQLINGPAVTPDCLPVLSPPLPAGLPLAAQMTETGPKGHRRVRTAWQGRQFQCFHDGDSWRCHCPVPGPGPMSLPVPLQAPSEDGSNPAPSLADSRLPTAELHPGFSLAFQGLERPDASQWHRRTLRMVVQSCAQGQLSCTVADLPASSPLPPSSQAQLVVLASALTRLPGSALIGRTEVDLRRLSAAPAGLAMPPDAHGAWVVQAGGGIHGTENHLQGAPGSTATSLAHPDDPELAQDAGAFFQRFFGLTLSAYRTQPGLTTVDCSATPDCGTVLEGHVRAGRQWLWIHGPLRLTTPAALGRPEHPVLLICDGTVDLDAAVHITGLLYSHGASRLHASGTSLRIDGALLSGESSNLSGQVQIVYSAPALRALADQLGTWTRLPGGWAP